MHLATEINTAFFFLILKRKYVVTLLDKKAQLGWHNKMVQTSGKFLTVQSKVPTQNIPCQCSQGKLPDPLSYSSNCVFPCETSKCSSLFDQVPTIVNTKQTGNYTMPVNVIFIIVQGDMRETNTLFKHNIQLPREHCCQTDKHSTCPSGILIPKGIRNFKAEIDS